MKSTNLIVFTLVLFAIHLSTARSTSRSDYRDVLMPNHARHRRAERNKCFRETQNVVGDAELLIVCDQEMYRLASEKMNTTPEMIVEDIHKKANNQSLEIWYKLTLKPTVFWKEDRFGRQATRKQHFDMFKTYAAQELWDDGKGYDLVVLLTGHEWIDDNTVESGHGEFGRICTIEAVGIVEYSLGSTGRGIQQLAESILHSMCHIIGQAHIEDRPECECDAGSSHCIMSEGHAVGRKKYWDFCTEQTLLRALKSTQYTCIVNRERPVAPEAPPVKVPDPTRGSKDAEKATTPWWLYILLGVILLLMILFLIGFATRREQKRRKIAKAAREQLSRIDNDARSGFGGPGGFGGSQMGADARSGYSPLSAYPSNVSGGGRSVFTGNVSEVGGAGGAGGVTAEDLEARSRLNDAANSTLWSRLVGGGARSSYSEAPSAISTATASGINSSAGSNLSGAKRSKMTDVPKSTTSRLSGTASGLGTGASGTGSTASGTKRSNLPSKL